MNFVPPSVWINERQKSLNTSYNFCLKQLIPRTAFGYRNCSFFPTTAVRSYKERSWNLYRHRNGMYRHSLKGDRSTFRCVRKLRNATTGFVTSVCPSVHAWDNSAPTRRIFMKFDMGVFRKSAEKIQVLAKSDNNNGYFTWRPSTFVIISRSFFSKWEMCQTNVVENIKIHILNSIHFSRKSCRLYDVEKYGPAWQAIGDSMTRRMRTACWITKAIIQIHTLRTCNTTFPLNNGYANAPQCCVIVHGLSYETSIWQRTSAGYFLCYRLPVFM